MIATETPQGAERKEKRNFLDNLFFLFLRDCGVSAAK
jgi:hypothetical protein